MIYLDRILVSDQYEYPDTVWFTVDDEVDYQDLLDDFGSHGPELIVSCKGSVKTLDKYPGDD